ncbi:gamma-glutamyltransferase [Evansella sp. LMS18]|jgi:gamma-glutamyltranspeptidase/glutathione hydrolase|uniref:gamma-glutamyltransferase n=1 Tax=Evansella sp. LMS18 TaxID=2924033 RepID=UPI0026EA75EB|nr:gamma-glutamyltransferase [Evansella sp. LMS18]
MWLRKMTNIVGIPLIILFIIGAYIEINPERDEDQQQGQIFEAVDANNAFAVSASNSEAVQAGIEVMEKGGNAIDAAIAVSFMLGVVEPYGSGIGGGGSMLIFDPTATDQGSQMRYIDYRETAPLSLVVRGQNQIGEEEPLENQEDGDAGEEPAQIPQGPAAQQINLTEMRDFGVPGFLKGMAYLYDNYATMDFSDLIRPSIETAENGYTADRYLAERFHYAQHRLNHAEIPHFYPEHQLIQEGQLLVQTELAETLREIERLGPDSYFHEELATAMSERYPILTEQDFEEYMVLTNQRPSYGEFQGYQVYAAPPPLAGPVLIQSLYMAEMMNLGEHELLAETEPDIESYIDLVEKIAGINDQTYRARLGTIGDPHTSYTASTEAERIVSREFAGELVSRWESAQAERDEQFFQDEEDYREEGTESYVPPANRNLFAGNGFGTTETASPAVSFLDSPADINQHNNTTHFVVIDREGRMVSATHTLSNFFGSGEYYKGFFLNDQLSNFSSTEGNINAPAPGRRPRSFMTPTIFIRENEGAIEEVIGLGSPGGARIPMMLSQALIYHLIHGEDFLDAVERPRLQYDFNENTQQFEVRLEPRFTELPEYPWIREALIQRGYPVSVEYSDMYFGGIQALIFDARQQIITGSADTRRGGTWEHGEYNEGGAD